MFANHLAQWCATRRPRLAKASPNCRQEVNVRWPNSAAQPQKRLRAPFSRRSGDRLHAEMCHGFRNELSVAVAGNQDMHLAAMAPAAGHHEQAAVPCGNDQRFPLFEQLVRGVLAGHFPAAGKPDQADILRRDPAQDPLYRWPLKGFSELPQRSRLHCPGFGRAGVAQGHAVLELHLA